MSEPWIGQVDASGRIAWKRPRLVQSTLSGLAGRWVRVKTTPISANTALLFAYWFAVPVKLVAQHTGYSRAQAHVLLVSNCFGVIFDKVTGKQVPVQPSTSALSASHMSQLIHWVQPWAKKTYGLDIPAPFTAHARQLEEVRE